MKGFATFLGICAISLGVMVTTGTKAPMTASYEEIQSSTIIQRDHTNIVREYESLEDASVITNIPDSVIMESILHGKQTEEGYEFSYK